MNGAAVQRERYELMWGSEGLRGCVGANDSCCGGPRAAAEMSRATLSFHLAPQLFSFHLAQRSSPSTFLAQPSTSTSTSPQRASEPTATHNHHLLRPTTIFFANRRTRVISRVARCTPGRPVHAGSLGSLTGLCSCGSRGATDRPAGWFPVKPGGPAGHFSKWTRSTNPSWSDSEVDQFITSQFPGWFEDYFVHNQLAPHDVAWSLSYGAARVVTRFKKYIINGYRFATVEACENISSCNYGVCCRGGQVNGVEGDYYGKLIDIIKLDYKWDKSVTLFKCDWFDNTSRGTRVDKYGNVEVHWSRRYTLGYDPFILAQQAEQVYYTLYPTSHQGWRGVIKTKARNIIPMSKESETNDLTEPFQADVERVLPLNIGEDDVPRNLFDSAAELELIPVQMDNEESDDDEQEISSGSEPALDDYETPQEDVQQDLEEQESSD